MTWTVNKKGKTTATTKHDRPVLQLKVKGPGVRSGRIPIPELVRLCQEAQNAVNRQAEALEGRKTVHPGPISANIQSECTLELIGIRKGSTILQFGFAKPQLPLPFEEDSLRALGVEVVTELASTIESLGNGNKKSDIAPGVLQSLYTMGGLIGGKHIEQIEWMVPRNNGHRRIISAPITAKVRERVAQRLSAPQHATVTVNGILDMADFKPKERKCRIDPAIGTSIMCAFGPEQEQKIYDLMRKPVRAIGEAKLQPYSEKIEVLQIREVYGLPSLALGEGNFFADKPLGALAAEQSVPPLQRISILAGGIPADEDLDAFLEGIYNARS